MTKSIISLDLGGKNTGFFSFTTDNIQKIDSFQSGTIIYNESFVLSQVSRRVKRHTKRNNLRNKLAKRLFLLILQKHYGVDIAHLPDEILGLFNKRGYTYAGLEIGEEDKNNLESDALREFFEEKLEKFPIESDQEIEQFLNQIASKEESFSSFTKEFSALYESSTHKPKNKTELTDEIKELFEDKEDQKELLDGLKFTKSLLEEFDKQQNQGNLPRVKYFAELKEYIDTTHQIQQFFANRVDLEKAYRLIANISNFQLKELRRYFNDPDMAKGDIWLENKLHKIVCRFISSWHPKGDKKLKDLQKDLLANLKNSNIIDFLTTTDPGKTIPPYDDMNNRGAVKCHSLRLNIEYLDNHLPNWRVIAEKLSDPVLQKELDRCTTNKSEKDLTMFHRVLDRSSKIDPYKLRDLDIQNYADILGKDEAEKFKKFTQNYYDLINKKVRTGIWQATDDIFVRCNHNTPYKNNSIHTLVSAILGVEINEDLFKAFEDDLWKKKHGNKKLSSYCKNIEELRKKKGNLFKAYIEELKEVKKPDSAQKKDINLLKDEQLQFWANEIANFFKIDEIFKSRFENHFSMAQLYTIIETRRGGFMSTCKWCSAENSFRSATNTQNFTLYDKTSGEKLEDTIFDDSKHIKVYEHANAQRLPADTQRPFSGKIDRYIDKLAYEIVKIKSKEIAQTTASEIDLKIVLEQNSFEYEESIRGAKIKNANNKANKSLEEGKKTYEKSLEDKDSRIKSFSESICAYCGESLGEDGEIDHILPRSYTLKNYGTVFNSEGNLLYVHQKCNQAKRDNIYKFSDIKSPLTQDEIQKEIETIRGYRTFTLLTKSQQKAFKFALFLPSSSEAYKKVVGFLRTDQSSRVNGTQKYLAKKIQEKLVKQFEGSKRFEFEFILANSEDVSKLRKDYAKQNPVLEKPKDSKQASSSHTIDAVLALASVYKKATGLDEMPTADEVVQFVQVNSWSAIKNEIPIEGKKANETIENMLKKDSYSKKEMQKVFQKPIFKEEAIGERFKPLFFYKDNFYIGYPKRIKNGYDISFCKKIDSSKQIDLITSSIESKYLTLTKSSDIIKIYTVDKKLFNEDSNRFFNYSSLTKEEEEKSLVLEFILNNFKYFTKKESAVSAPQIISDTKLKGYPFFDEWISLHNRWREFLKEEPPTKKENGKTIYDTKAHEEKWLEFCREFFKNTSKNKNQTIRKKARKVFSLITLTSPSGTVLRVKRKTLKGDSLYQAVAINNKQISGDYAPVLLKANSKNLALATKSPLKTISKKITIKKEMDIRDISIPWDHFFEIEDLPQTKVFLNKTTAVIKGFPMSIFKDFVQGFEEFKEKTTIPFAKNSESGIIKDRFVKILKLTPRTDMSISGVSLNETTVDFTIPYRDTSKLLND